MTTKLDLYDLIARTGQALANGKRLEILELVAQRERGVNDLAQLAHLNVTTVSAHLQILREAGLVTARREGTHVSYSLAGDDVAELLARLNAVAESRRGDVSAAVVNYLPDRSHSVTREELAVLGKSAEVFLLDARPADEFDAGHVPGAVNIPVDQLASRMGEIPRSSTVVTYCRGKYCLLAHQAAAVLSENGWTAHVLDEGVLEWRALGSAREAS
ncbi:MAG: ArsR family transcriptional regulator [Actinobacteria bacterium HGW-Actinobacteria-4]|nr:MAG: ArsR family transcriptional regulator [Actinobacteria bacterium HGW-Actinobacteria-4]